MGVNTVADGEQPRPEQQRGTEQWNVLAASLCVLRSPLPSREKASRDNIVFKISKLSHFPSCSIEISHKKNGEKKSPKFHLHE